MVCIDRTICTISTVPTLMTKRTGSMMFENVVPTYAKSIDIFRTFQIVGMIDCVQHRRHSQMCIDISDASDIRKHSQTYPTLLTYSDVIDISDASDIRKHIRHY